MRNLESIALSTYQAADALKDIEMVELETINPFTLASGETSRTIVDETARAQVDRRWASTRNGVAGAGGAVQLPLPLHQTRQDCLHR